jgi:hypothetical protein
VPLIFFRSKYWCLAGEVGRPLSPDTLWAHGW